MLARVAGRYGNFAKKMHALPAMSSRAKSTALAQPNVENYDSVDTNQEEAMLATSQRTFAYATLGGARFMYAAGARGAIVKFVGSMSAAADTLAMSTVEIDCGSIPMGETSIVKWRGKPIFVRRRTPEQISAAVADDNNPTLRDPETDAERVINPEFAVLLGVCTHLGCVPMSDAGEYNGWYCPCHGSHYDLSGRIRKGPAPLNLEIPEHKYISDTVILVG